MNGWQAVGLVNIAGGCILLACGVDGWLRVALVVMIALNAITFWIERKRA